MNPNENENNYNSRIAGNISKAVENALVKYFHDVPEIRDNAELRSWIGCKVFDISLGLTKILTNGDVNDIPQSGDINEILEVADSLDSDNRVWNDDLPDNPNIDKFGNLPGTDWFGHIDNSDDDIPLR